MFDLEAQIKAWRQNLEKQKVGVREVLDELESHLRLEIEQQLKLRLPEAEAFRIAEERIGNVQKLKKEFRKNKGYRHVIKASLLSAGWLAAGATFFYSAFGLEFHWNFWHWSPTWNLETAIEVGGLVLALIAIWFLAKSSRDRSSRAVSFLICIAYIGMAIYAIGPEPTTGTGMFGRSQPSPSWYRIGRLLLFCAPAGIWLWSLKPNRSTRAHNPSFRIAN